MTRMLSRTLLAATILLGAFGCFNEPVTRQTTNNADVPLDLLFTSPEGCRVYRFVDGVYPRYFAACPGATVMSGHLQSTGKTAIMVPETIATVRP